MNSKMASYPAREAGFARPSHSLARALTRVGVALVLCVGSGIAAAGTLDAILERGYLKCGVQAGHRGLAAPDYDGVWQGFDVDFCRAVAAAVLGDASQVMYVSSDRLSGVDSLRSGSVDLVARQPLTPGHAGEGVPVHQVGILLHDSYGFLTAKSDPLASLASLSGQKVCLVEIGDAARAIPAYLDSQGIPVEWLPSKSLRTTRERYAAGECTAVAGLRSDLAGIRARLDEPADHVLLPDHVGKAPGGPAVLPGDKVWADIVEWVLFALIEAEEIGVSSSNVDEQRAASHSARVRRLLGVEGDIGSLLGLQGDWGYRIVHQVGNYGEIYDRNLGPGTRLNLDRGLNRLWSRGGILYAPPLTAH